MVKGILLLVIMLACAGIGRTMSGVRRKRCEFIGETLAALRVLRLRMLNSMEPLGVLLRKAQLQLFCDLGNSLRSGCTLQECWTEIRAQQYRQRGELSMLSAEDIKILDDFFRELGKSGRDEQAELFALTIARFEEAQTEARSRYGDASKMFTALGTLAGIGICVMIL